MSFNMLKSDRHNALSHNSEVKNHKGFLWRGWMENTAIGAGAHHYMSMQIADKPIRISQVFYATDSVKSHVDLYEGGAVSGGNPVPYETMNLDFRNPIANVITLSGATIDTPGTLIIPRILRGSASLLAGRSIASGDADSSVILGRNQLYYMDIFNEDAQSRVFDFYFLIQVRTDN